ncbi:RNA polymerase sigma factor [Pusillimonas noertemannii]|uniref:RNA polymerase sigma-70 factor (ECF subfamily) n=1 Tax=Pusillimonas noertemannii TaxID=305977 RepID=A0A2U1CQ77_9BURK|nr:sigma-70 family RNA polymerase sigma factor [Pusillimonas noertemannii]NYT67365.1 sigma-70 family RNA polymerase sigma factor [Pusillimonas noertemannii]PVY68038.1 RNA polymerase sigma-70 factor (ECF subfamily) [Pusillimonas noertemannii]TFL12450.1 sigma-70 family RNA polymerase sigma factor [Pusillimonas noertemannii]
MSRPIAPKKGWLAHYSELLGLWAKRSSTPQDAEDAVQDAALSMLEASSFALRDHGHYFRRVAVNRSISIYRAERVRETQALDQLPEALHPTAPSAQELYEAGELARIMLSALNGLPQACQTAFKLRQAEGLSNGEIAQRMGVSRNMVERYMMRTLRHLQDELQRNAQ